MDSPTYEQRHYNSLTGEWSGWYRSSEAAYREHCAGPVKCYEVRPVAAHPKSICRTCNGIGKLPAPAVDAGGGLSMARGAFNRPCPDCRQPSLLPDAPPRHDAGGKVKLALPAGMQGDAEFTGPGDCWRITLRRWWGDLAEAYANPAAWCGMNPSTAEADLDDPTVKKETGFCRRWGYSSYLKINVGDFRATHPRDLAKANMPLVDWASLRLKVSLAKSAPLLVMAFGNLPKPLLPHGRELVSILQARGVAMHCLGTNADGSPVHPLYQKNSSRPMPWNAAAWLQAVERR